MLERVGTHFPSHWQYGPEEIHIFNSTVEQVESAFPNDRNLVINTTWFGSQFENNEYKRAMSFTHDFDNLFLLSVIDPVYLTSEDLDRIVKKYNIKNIYRIGMFENSLYEWNFHAIVGKDLMPRYTEEQVILDGHPNHVFMLYQRKPRVHRIEITNFLRNEDLLKHGIVSLGSPNETNWHQGLEFIPIFINDNADSYKHNGPKTDHGGVPNDLVTVGRLDLWKDHFLNIVSETVFDEWDPLLITEKTWKAIIGLRPFLIHGNPKTYQWLRKNGFKTFNQYWSHIPVEEIYDGFGPHDAVLRTIRFLSEKSKEDLYSMYVDMLPDLRYNKQRFYEFSQEQTDKMENIFR